MSKSTGYKTWTPEQVAQYIENWKNNRGAELSKVYGVSLKTIGHINRQFGVTRPKGWKMRGEGHMYAEQPKKNNKRRYDSAPVGTIQYALQKGHRLPFIINKNREAKKALVLQRAEERKRQREYREKEKLRAKELSRAIQNHDNRSRRKEKQFKTMPVDLSKLIPVRIDHRTIVFAKRVEDIPGIKAKYSKAG
jgi:hypothetical protein